MGAWGSNLNEAHRVLDPDEGFWDSIKGVDLTRMRLSTGALLTVATSQTANTAVLIFAASNAVPIVGMEGNAAAFDLLLPFQLPPDAANQLMVNGKTGYCGIRVRAVISGTNLDAGDTLTATLTAADADGTQIGPFESNQGALAGSDTAREVVFDFSLAAAGVLEGATKIEPGNMCMLRLLTSALADTEVLNIHNITVEYLRNAAITNGDIRNGDSGVRDRF